MRIGIMEVFAYEMESSKWTFLNKISYLEEVRNMHTGEHESD